MVSTATSTSTWTSSNGAINHSPNVTTHNPVTHTSNIFVVTRQNCLPSAHRRTVTSKNRNAVTKQSVATKKGPSGLCSHTTCVTHVANVHTPSNPRQAHFIPTTTLILAAVSRPPGRVCLLVRIVLERPHKEQTAEQQDREVQISLNRARVRQSVGVYLQYLAR